MPNFTVVCLANSKKMQGRCLAGRKWSGGGMGDWIRPVSDREHEEVSEWERQYHDGGDPRVLDIVKIPLLEARPKNWQVENWLLDPTKHWIKLGELSKKDLKNFVEPEAPLWINGHNTYHGLNDRVPLSETNAWTGSLRLISAKVALKVFVPGQDFGNPKQKVQASFEWNGVSYKLIVTDPWVEREYLGKQGEHDLGRRYLTVSLGEAYKDFTYKLIAAII